jgi:cytochrome c-type biogenesis protein CcmH
MAKDPKNNIDSLKAQLRQIDDLASKGLLREEEADEARTALRKRLLEALMPDVPAPRLPWRARLWALGAMAVLVGSLAAYLMSGHAGLRRLSEELLDQGKSAVAKRQAEQQESLERLRADKARASDAAGLFPAGEAASGGAGARDAAAAAPLLSGRVELAASLASKIAPEDALFIVVRLPDDPTGLPLAAIRRQAGELPFAFQVGEHELVGSPQRFAQAERVVVTARISKSGAGQAKPGDLTGTARPVAPGSKDVAVVIDQVVP